MAETRWYVLAAGSNVAPASNLPAALDKLRERVAVRRVSTVVETAPVDAPGTPDFLNAALLVDSELEPGALKREVLRPIEAALGRVRGADPNAPRTIDLDLVLWEGGALEDPDHGVVLPEPDLATLAHLAIPVGELVPDWIDAESGLPLSQIAAGFEGVARRVELDGWDSPSRASGSEAERAPSPDGAL